MKHFFGFVTVIAIAIIATAFYFYSQIKVDLSKIINYNPKQTTQIYDRNGDLVANIFDEENRLYATYNEIPAQMIEALVAIEDTSFFEHGGINTEAIFRAVVKDIKAMAFVEGASTLTQQLVKNMVLTREKKITRKIKEFIFAFEIESMLTKEEILERYLNEIYLGHGYHGVKTAALGYFKKQLNELSLKEIAMLVGLPKAPSSFDPTKHLDLSLSRANSVISRLYSLGWINKDTYEKSIKEVPTIYDETLTQNKAPYLVEEAIKEASKYVPDVKTGGYKITLTADLKVQQLAKNALIFGYNEILKRDKNADENQLNGAIVVTNPLNGQILALVGGVNFSKSNFNRATQAQRQPGSSFKPFIYQVALNLGYSPMSKVADIPRVFENKDKENQDETSWKPKNYSGNYEGYITLQDAIKRSRNLATINLTASIGLDVLINQLSKFGFTNLPPNLSIALGSFGIDMLTYSQNYSVFAGMGNIAKSYLIQSITSKNFSVKIEPQIEEIIPAQQAYLMVDMLKNVVIGGTGRAAKIAGIDIAGKTGTTNNSVDAWFCGFTPELQAIIWYGNDNNTPMRKTEGGGRSAAPVFREFLTNYLKLFPQTKRNFETPKGVYHKIYNGSDSDYTDISPLPQSSQDTVFNQQKDGLLF